MKYIELEGQWSEWLVEKMDGWLACRLVDLLVGCSVARSIGQIVG